jgi:hypothetical protein
MMALASAMARKKLLKTLVVTIKLTARMTLSLMQHAHARSHGKPPTGLAGSFPQKLPVENLPRLFESVADSSSRLYDEASGAYIDTPQRRER